MGFPWDSRPQVTYFLPQQFRSVVEAAGASWRPLQRPHEMTEAARGFCSPKVCGIKMIYDDL
jgi:hypothetical protein